MECLNLGCGSRFHPDWTNVDVTSSGPYVQAQNLRQCVPFPDNSFDVVYHSHLLEHFPKGEALIFMRECYRVLKPGGIIRVTVPDLEQIARMYLQALDNALQRRSEWDHDYEWIMLELYDQSVRERPGGEILDYLKQDAIPNEGFVYGRIGREGRRIDQAPRTGLTQGDNWHATLRHLILRLGHFPHFVRDKLLRGLLGEHDLNALRIGRFRLRGEVHHWMYDRYSLAWLLRRAGFQNPVQRTAFESAIEGWLHFNLDTEADGTVHKPDSLYMEAVKPVG